jgi:Fe-S cluster biogenesis protein NfuA
MGLLKRRSNDGAAIEARIHEAIDGLRPMLGVDGSGVELLSFDAATGVLVLRAEGDCTDCRLSIATFIQGIEAHLRMRVPEIREVRMASLTRPNG